MRLAWLVLSLVTLVCGTRCGLFPGWFLERHIVSSHVDSLEQQVQMAGVVSDELLNELTRWHGVASRLEHVDQLWGSLLKTEGKEKEVLRYSQQLLALLTDMDFLWAREKVTTVLCLQAEVFMHFGDLDRAFSGFSQVLTNIAYSKTMPWSKVYHQELFANVQVGKLLLQRGEAGKALLLFLNALYIDGSDMEAHRGAGQSLVLLLKGRHDDELEERMFAHLTRAVQLGCNDTSILIRVGKLLAQREEWDEAGRRLGLAVELAPEHAGAHVELGRVLQSRAASLGLFEGMSDTSVAYRLLSLSVSHYQQATWLDRDYFDAFLELGVALMDQGRKQEAVAQWEHAVTINPAHLSLRMLLVKNSELVGVISHAKVALELISPSDSQSIIFVASLLGDAYAACGNLKSAAGQYKLAISMGSSLSETYLRLGTTLAKLHKHEESVQQFKHAMEKNSNFSDNKLRAAIYLGMARSTCAMGKEMEGLQYYLNSIELGVRDMDAYLETVRLLEIHFPSSEKIVQLLKQAALEYWPYEWMPSLLLGQYFFSVSHEDAAVHLQRAVSLNPNCLECLMLLSETLIHKRRYNRALEALTHAVSLDPLNAAILLMMADALESMKQLESSRNCLEKAIELLPDQVDIAVRARMKLSPIYLQLGKSQDSIRVLQEAALLAPGDSSILHSLFVMLTANGQPKLALGYKTEALRLEQAKFDLTIEQCDESISWTGTLRKLGTRLFPALGHQAVVTVISNTQNFTGHCSAKSSMSLVHGAGSLLQLGRMFASKGEVFEAADCYQQVIMSRDPALTPQAQFLLGHLIKDKEPERAVELFSSAGTGLKTSDPNRPAAFLWAAKIRTSTTGVRMRLLNDAILLYSNMPWVYHAFGVEMELVGEPQDAFNAFTDAAILLQSNRSLVAADLFFRRATIAKQHGLMEGSDILNLMKNAHDASQSCSEVLQFQNGFMMIDEVLPVSLVFDDCESMYLASQIEIASLYREIGRGQESTDLLIQALNGHRWLGRILMEVGMNLLEDQQPAIALAMLRGALAVEDLPEARKLLVLHSKNMAETAVHAEILATDNIGNISVTDAVARLLAIGELERAIALQRTYLKNNDDPAHKRGLLDTIATKGKLDEARRYLSDAVLKPDALEFIQSLTLPMRNKLASEMLRSGFNVEEFLDPSDCLTPSLCLHFGQHSVESPEVLFNMGLGPEFSFLDQVNDDALRYVEAMSLIIMYVPDRQVPSRVVLSDSELHCQLAAVYKPRGYLIRSLVHQWWCSLDTPSYQIQMDLGHLLVEISNEFSDMSMFRMASVHFTRARAYPEATIDSACALGDALYLQGLLDESEIVYQDIPDVFQCGCKHAGLGMIHHSNGNTKEAMNHLVQFWSHRNSPSLLFNASIIAMVHMQFTDLAIARDLLCFILDDKDLFGLPSRTEVEYKYALILYRNNEFGLAIDALESLQDKQLGSKSEFLNNLGAAYFRFSKYEYAISRLQGAIEECSQSGCSLAPRINLALVFQICGRNKEAIDQLGIVLESKFEFVSEYHYGELVRQLARLHVLEGNVGIAVKILRTNAKKTNSNMELLETWREFGLLLSESGQHQEAVRLLRNVLLMRCNERYFDNGASFLTLWEVLDSLPVKAIESKLGSPEALIDLGNAYLRAQMFKQAKSIYGLTRRIFPFNSHALNNLGVIAFKEQRWKESSEYFTLALEIDPENEIAAFATKQVTAGGPAPFMMELVPDEFVRGPFEQGTPIFSK